VTAHPADPTHVLDDVVRAALLGPHAHLAERRGRVLRYPVDVCPFLAFPDDPGEDDWRDLADLAGPGEVTGLAAAAVPDGWEVIFTLDGVQMVDDGIPAAPDPEAVELGPADVPEMLDLVERTRPGPFRPRTIAMGTYLGIRRGGVDHERPDEPRRMTLHRGRHRRLVARHARDQHHAPDVIVVHRRDPSIRQRTVIARRIPAQLRGQFDRGITGNAGVLAERAE